jgi:RNA polymerase sigma-70 factor (ECF subfamily)
VLVLRDVEGLSAQEVAEVLGISADAVKSRLHRARRALRDHLLPFVDAVRPEPDCPDVIGLLSQYIEGDISPETCKNMEAHVSSCQRCAARCDSLRQVLAACSSIRAPVVPEALRVSVLAEMRRALREPRVTP